MDGTAYQRSITPEKTSANPKSKRKSCKKGVKVYRTAILQEYTVKTQPNGFVHTFHGPVKKQVECFKKYEKNQKLSPLQSVSSVGSSKGKVNSS
jgi:hypothetical protein